MHETDNRWQKLKDVFNEVVELAPESRSDFLDSLRLNEKTLYQEVAELLEAENESVEFLHKPIILNTDNSELSIIGETVGHYKIVREIGCGGMGAVFEAVRHDGEFEQKAAVKLTNQSIFSDELVRRFRTEKQILAKLEHKNIVRLLDGGITAKHIPFYVMEFVEGKPINEFCRENTLSINERLELFLQVCEAVAYAHQQLIVHRDLKPSNILVTAENQVKLLDFGIAKILDEDAQTLTVNTPLTPEYASPEQIKGETITTASDIYSLGVILYELLTENSPHEIYGVQRNDIFRAVCENEPLRPSSVVSRQLSVDDKRATKPNAQKTKSLKGDLDNIILKALQKEKELRYFSVEQFAEDIKSYLQGLPVKAHPQSFDYRAKKFFKRNRLIVSLSTISLLLIITGASVAVWQFFAARNQQQIAERRFAQVRKIANSLIFDYHDEIAKLDGSTKLREKLVSDAVEYLNAISQEAENDTELMKEIAVAYRKIGDVQGQPYGRNLGKLAEAVISYEKSVSILENAVSIAPNDTLLKDELVISYKAFAQAELRTEERNHAKTIMQKAVQINGNLISADIDNIERKITNFGLKIILGDSQPDNLQALEIYKQTAIEAESLLKEYPQNEKLVNKALVSHSRISNLSRWVGDAEKEKGNIDFTKEYYLQALEHSYKTLQYDAPNYAPIPNQEIDKHSLAISYSNIAACLIRLERYDEALKNTEISLKLFDESRTNDEFDQEAILGKIGEHNIKHLILISQNKTDLAVENLKPALELAIECSRRDPMNAEAISWIGYLSKETEKLLRLQKKQVEAEKYGQIYNSYEIQFREKFNKEWTFNF
jgi:eukaryotic-like serine/threonine-protein kinase